MSEPTKTEVIKAFALMCNSGLVKPAKEWFKRGDGMSPYPRHSLWSYAGNYLVAYCELSVFVLNDGVADLWVASVGSCKLNRAEYGDVIHSVNALILAKEDELIGAAEKTARGILSRAREIHNKAVDHASKEESRKGEEPAIGTADASPDNG